MHTAVFTETEGEATNSENSIIPLVSLATKDAASVNVESQLLTADEWCKQLVINNVKQRLIEQTVGFHDTLKKNHSMTFADLYKTTVSPKFSVQKTIKADRKLLQRLLNAVAAGRTVHMVDVLKHELSPVPLFL